MPRELARVTGPDSTWCSAPRTRLASLAAPAAEVTDEVTRMLVAGLDTSVARTA